jgi:hypothetical protein
LKAQTERASKAKLRKFAKQGYDDPICFQCWERDLRTINLHHVAGEANSSLCVPLCANCHDVASDTQEDLVGGLRLRDPDRRPLVLQAAFDLGLSIMAGAVAISAREATEATFWGLIAVALAGWAIWNLTADMHFATQFGSDYSAGVMAPVPR